MIKWELAESKEGDIIVYLIGYDLRKPGKNYEDLYTAIKDLGEWWHYLDSTWLVDTNLDSTQIFNKLHSCIDNNDSILVIKVTKDYSGWLSEKAWAWLNSHL